MRKKIISGNWKMNLSPNEAEKFLKELIPALQIAKSEVVLCVPFVDIAVAKELTKGTNIKVGAQNCHFEEAGAFTGEISANMLKSVSVDYVILGHSERRAYFAETDEMINKKVKSAVKQNLKVILCVGETLDQRESNTTNDIIKKQIFTALQGIEKNDLKNIIIAYEPVWAIGTGKTATSGLAEEVCKYIRDIIRNLYDLAISDGVVILYGGSMNAKNAKDLLSQKDIDGGLIGGSSLKIADFSEIVNIADEI